MVMGAAMVSNQTEKAALIQEAILVISNGFFHLRKIFSFFDNWAYYQDEKLFLK